MTRRRFQALLSLGSNVEPERWVPQAVGFLGSRFEVVAASPRYDVPAVGGAGQPAFVNLALRIRTDLPLRALREACRRVEERCERRRGADRFAPRTMDVDVVYLQDAAGRVRFADRSLTKEVYVLVPAAAVWPEAVAPPGSRPLSAHRAALPAEVLALPRARPGDIA